MVLLFMHLARGSGTIALALQNTQVWGRVDHCEGLASAPPSLCPVPRHGHRLSLEEVNVAGLFHHVPSCTGGAGQVSAKYLPGCPEGRERAWPVDGT